jgi:DNA repair protein RadA/Sms
MLEKRLGIPMMGCDIYVNAAGGLEIKEPAADLSVFAAILSSFRNRSLPTHTVLLGELSLSGEVRPINQVYPRVREAAAMGFRKCIVPQGNLPLINPVENIELIPIRAVSQLSDLIFFD